MSSSGTTPSSAPVITVRGLAKRYEIYDKPHHRLWQGLMRGRRQWFREFWALRDIDFSVGRGETVGIVGRNGSGKSTLLQVVAGTLSPTRGEVVVNGRVAALLELGSGFNPEFTGRENVYLNASILGLDRAQIDERYQRIVDFAEIGEFVDQPVKTYSSGMFLRLAFAVIAHVDADLLIIDEALSVGDAAFTQKCMRFLREFQSRGTILFVSHDAAAVLALCERAVWLHQGAMAMAGPAKEVVEAYMQSIAEANQGGDPLAGARAANAGARAAEASPEAGRIEAGASPRAEMSADARSFGQGGARVEAARLVDEAGRMLALARGGQRVRLEVLVRAERDLNTVIVGFHFKDRLGQVLIGENTAEVTRHAPVSAAVGERVSAAFEFTLPELRNGDYALDIAVAEGTQLNHVQHQWIFDAIVIPVHTEAPVYGLFCAPERVIRLERGDALAPRGEGAATA